MSSIKVIGTTGKPAIDRTGAMCADILALIYDHSGTMPIATAIGVLEIVKAQLIEDAT